MRRIARQIPCIFLRSVSEGLLGIELDDKLLFEFEVDIVSCRKSCNLCNSVLSIKLNPLGSCYSSKAFKESLDLCAFLAGFLNGDNVTSLNKDRGNGYLLTVKSEVCVENKASLTAATMMSPTPAYLLVEPPRTLMHRSSFAPLLSATFSLVSC